MVKLQKKQHIKEPSSMMSINTINNAINNSLNNGAHNRNWTGDLFLTKKVLYRLSYVGKLVNSFR